MTDNLCFVFQISTAHRTLRSFPTRRSSDLMVRLMGAGEGSRGIIATRPALCQEPRDGWTGRLRPAMIQCRSEEHTSELQSHSDLVCRLLLEKKKNSDVTLTFPQDRDIVQGR